MTAMQGGQGEYRNGGVNKDAIVVGRPPPPVGLAKRCAPPPPRQRAHSGYSWAERDRYQKGICWLLRLDKRDTCVNNNNEMKS